MQEDEHLSRLAAAFGRRYAIEQEIGRGGTATVYRALDRRHGRLVALKILGPEIAAAIGADRFLREIAIVARLSHPHILPLYDSGQAAGSLYYVMPLMAGETLRDRLRRERQLPIEDALRITAEIADALGYAHRQGVVHRDVKPENVLFSDGHALLSDFGVARQVASEGVELTEPGMVVGTAAYMSPEQAAGASPDARSDLYALGVVTYEMLSGELPYSGTSARAIILKRAAEPYARLRTLRDTVPEPLEDAVCTLLERDPADRFQSAQSFSEALSAARDGRVVEKRPGRRGIRRLLVAPAAAIVLLALSAAAVLRSARSESIDTHRVLVALFENQSGDPSLDAIADVATDYVARGLTETRLISDVYDAHTQRLMRGDTSRSTVVSDLMLAKAVRAGMIVRGSYFVDRDTLHFETMIVEGRSGRLVRSVQPAAGPIADRTRVVELLRQHVMAAFATTVGPAFASWRVQSTPPSFEAYEEMLAGGDAMWRFEFAQAREHFERAAAADPSYLGAKVSQASADALFGACDEVDSIARLVLRVRTHITGAERAGLDWATAKCRRNELGELDAALAALAIEPHSAGWAIFGYLAASQLGRRQQALEILERVDVPSSGLSGRPLAVFDDFLADARLRQGKRQEALEAARQGVAAAPSYANIVTTELTALAALGRTREVDERVTQVLAGRVVNPDPAAPSAGQVVGCVANTLRTGNQAEWGRALMARAADWYHAQRPSVGAEEGEMPCRWNILAPLYYAGDPAVVRAMYEQLFRSDSTNVRVIVTLAALAARRGDRSDAMRWDDAVARYAARTSESQSYPRARIAALLGDRDRAVALVSRAYEANETVPLDADPDFDSLRSYPPLVALRNSHP